MNYLEIIIIVIFITVTTILVWLSFAALQLIKELKTSLSKLNKILDKPENISAQPLKKLEETLNIVNPPKTNSPPRLFHRGKQ